jgi:hypothetical protein
VRSPYCAGNAPSSSATLWIGNHHAVNAVLQIGMIATHVKLTIGVLHHARRLQQHLVHRGGIAQRQRLDVLRGDHVLTAAGIRRKAVTRRIQRRRHAYGPELLDLAGMPVGRTGIRRVIRIVGGLIGCRGGRCRGWGRRIRSIRR